MKKITLNIIKGLFATSLLLSLLIPINHTSAQSVLAKKWNVPNYYYANREFIDSWNDIWTLFNDVKARSDLDLNVDSSYFIKLWKDFNQSFPHLHTDYRATYEKCILLAQELANWYSEDTLKIFMWNSCYNSLSSAATKINSLYTVKASATASPNNWSAPLTVTFDARGSTDPSSETIPTDNFFRYYRDEKWVDTPMWKWDVLTYTFDEAGKFIVHLVVRSSNVKDWILDWEKDLTINVSPKTANIVVYANTRKMQSNSAIKIWTAEAEKWVVFDWSATMPIWGRQIASYKWEIVNSAAGFSYSKQWSGTPSYVNVPLKWDWEFKVTLTITDNQNNRVSQTFSIHVSDPVAIIKQSPVKWTTSTTFTFDGSSSYSLEAKLASYLREITDENWDKIHTEQGKSISYQFLEPWNYLVKLTITDAAARQNVEILDVYVESTTPIPQFTSIATKKWTYPSEFTLDASSSSDIDVLNWIDSLEYNWIIDWWTITSTTGNNEKVVVHFNEVGEHTIKLTVTDLYGKSASITKSLKISSILRPEITAIPNAITRWKVLKFESTVNTWVSNYVRDFWDGKTMDSQYDAEVTHTYWSKWIYTVTLKVYDKEGNSNTVTEKVFIGEVEYPIAAYRVKDQWWYYLQASETCKVESAKDWTVMEYQAYPIDRYANFTINPSISVNTHWTSNGLQYAFEKESIVWLDQAVYASSLTHKFNQTWCHYVDLTVQDTNVGKQDKVRIRFKVKNALPTVKNVNLFFPQYSNESSIGFGTATTTDATNFACEDGDTSSLTIKVTAVNASDSDGTISRLRFYYYNIDDPDRILEYKDSWISAPYAYFVVPRSSLAWEYKFWVMVYDNDGGMVDSKDVLWSNPSVYFQACGDPTKDIPVVTLKSSATRIDIWDTVNFTAVAKVTNNIDDFEVERTFYYDFTWDWSWDLITKNDEVSYTFKEVYENGVTPRVAVEYRWLLWKADWAEITVRNWIKPVLLYNSYKNIVIFRDLSSGVLQQRQICFDTEQCALWNSKYRRTHVVDITWDEAITSRTNSPTPITENIWFLQIYPSYWTYGVSLYLKNKYGTSVMTWFTVTTSENTSNGRIAPGVNMITIPETTFTNWNPEIFLSSVMDNTIIMYLSHENWDNCYIDIDISTDSNWDGVADNDADIACNTLAKITYEPNYENSVWRVYFTNDGKLKYKNFYVSFEWYVLELTDEELSLYRDITTLINGIEDITDDNVNLKSSLVVLRKNLKSNDAILSSVMAIRDQLEVWYIKIDAKQKELLDSILERLSTDDTVYYKVWMSEYEKNKAEILAILPSAWKWEIEQSFKEFEDNISNLDPEWKASYFTGIWMQILTKWSSDGSLDDFAVANVLQPSFCNIINYYDCWAYVNTCVESNDITDHFGDMQGNTESTSRKMPWWLKVILIILVWWVLIMWWAIVFFALKARNGDGWEDDES